MILFIEFPPGVYSILLRVLKEFIILIGLKTSSTVMTVGGVGIFKPMRLSYKFQGNLFDSLFTIGTF